jgi:hypothetical protein
MDGRWSVLPDDEGPEACPQNRSWGRHPQIFTSTEVAIRLDQNGQALNERT